jgi:hypothetical protein
MVRSADDFAYIIEVVAIEEVEETGPLHVYRSA